MKKEVKIWKRVFHTNKSIKYRNKNLDIVNIKSLRPNSYETGNNYEIKFNKYILGIFKTQYSAHRFAKLWMKLHS